MSINRRTSRRQTGSKHSGSHRASSSRASSTNSGRTTRRYSADWQASGKRASTREMSENRHRSARTSRAASKSRPARRHESTNFANEMQGLADRRPHIFIAIAAIFIVMTLGFTGHVVREIVDPGHTHLFQQQEGGFPEEVEQWRGVVEIACKDCDVDTKWVDTILAMMQVESGGDVNVDSVVGCEQDIMQAGEGCAGVDKGEKNVVQLGAAALYEWDITPSQEVDGGTGVSSIYAGVLETKFTVAMFEEWLGGIDVDDVGKIGLIAQGYNYGSDGWYAFCKNNDFETWSLYASLAYQSTIGGVGTADHGQKVMDAYEAAR